jgi:hypothetical protein
VGDAELRVTNLSFEMGTTDEFSLDQATLDSLPILLAPDEESEFDVIYTATDGINDYGVLNIVSNDPDEALVHIQLESTFKGTAVIAVDPLSLDFGDIPLGDVGRHRLTISNQGTGNAVLTVEGIQLGILVNPDYELESLPTFPTYLNRGDMLDITVAFHPTQVGTLTDRVIVVSSDTLHPQLEVPVTGRGVEPSLGVDPSPIDFGTVRVGTALPQDVRITNEGGADLSITGISLGGVTPEYELTSDPVTGFDLPNLATTPLVLTPGETRIVTLTYTPTDTNTDTDVMSIDSPDINPSPPFRRSLPWFPIRWISVICTSGILPVWRSRCGTTAKGSCRSPI